MQVKFWGTRGLISSPRIETAEYGGNTPCIQILHKDELIVVDTGFGCSILGDQLMERILKNKESLNIHIFYTHFHWDHVQGLPFFNPIYFPSTTLHLYSPEPTHVTLENLNILFDGSYSPFESLLTMQAKVVIHQIKAPLTLGDDLLIEYHTVDHGSAVGDGNTFGYRFTDGEGRRTVLLSDHEARMSITNASIVKWAKNADLLIHDAQYLESEYGHYIGWGHSSINQALDNALKCQARYTLLTHHAPFRNDTELNQVKQSIREINRYETVPFDFACEDKVYEVRSQATLTPKTKKGGT